MPVQRMPRYVMLIASLLEKTPEWHRDHRPLAQGLACIEEMVSGVDGAIERQENLQKTYDVARRLGMADLLSVDTRLYVRDGTLTKVCRKQDKVCLFCFLCVFFLCLCSSSFPPDSRAGAVVRALLGHSHLRGL